MDRRAKIAEVNPDAVLWDGLDDCIIGIDVDNVAVYDIYKMELEIMKLQDCTFDEAVEWVDYNILSAYVGEWTPKHIWVMPDDEDERE
jgi:hypothetical protein